MRKALLINDTSNEQHIGCNAVINNIKLECLKNGIEVVSTRDREDIYSLKHDKIYEKDIDLVIINGEGTFHHNQQLARKLVEILPFFKDSKKVLINSTWFKMDTSLKFGLLEQMEIVSVRESISHSEIIQLYPEAIIVPDVIFLTEFKSNRFGYGDSVRMDISKSFSQEGNYFPLCSQINTPDVHAYLNWLSTQELYITGRFHGVCLACIAGIPFLAIKSNCPKIESMLDDIGCPELMIDKPDDIKSDYLYNDLMAKAKNALPKIEAYVKMAREKNQELFRRL